MEHVTYPYSAAQDANWDSLSHLPGHRGLPLLGSLLAMVRDYHGFFSNCYKHYGSISRVNFGLQKGVLVISPEAARQILMDAERNFSNRMGYDSAYEWFPGGVMFRDFDDHRYHRRVFQTSFKSDAMRGYVELIDKTICEALPNWIKDDDFHFVHHIQNLLTDVSARVFYGFDNFGGQSAELRQAFLKMIEGMMAYPKINLPPFKYYYCKKSQYYVENYIRSLIRDSRDREGRDFVAYVTKERNDAGELFTDEELNAHLSFLFFASYDTTTAASSHMALHLAMDQALQDRVREECLSLEKKMVSYDELDRLPLIELCLLETIRLYPSVPMYLRRSIRECELDGYKIPPNTLLFISSVMIHRLEEWWTEPLKFDPDRFASGREEHKRHACNYIAFGGGAHKCIGMNFAIMNTKMVFFKLLTQYRLKVRDGYTPDLTCVPSPKPADDLPLVLEKL